MGDADEFRELFRQEATVRLARMSEQLLQLEQAAGTDAELVASLFREAHTLKGAAAVVGLDGVRQVCHTMEDLLDQLRAGTREATPDLIDVFLATVDGLEALVPAALAGDESAPEVTGLEAQLLAAAAPPTTTHEPSGPAVVGDAAADAAVEIAPDFGAGVEPEVAVEPGVGVAVGRRDGIEGGSGSGTGAPVAGPANRETETVMVPAERLDELVRLVGESAAAHLRIGRVLADRLGVDPSTVSEYRSLSRVLNELQERTMRARMVPIATITDRLHRAVRDLARTLGKDVRFEVVGAETEMDRGMLQQLADPLLHIVRNAVDHGIEAPEARSAAGKPPTASVELTAAQHGSEVFLTVRDDGGGIDVNRVRERASAQGTDTSRLTDDEVMHLIFRTGLSTATHVTDVSGRGVGLDVVRTGIDAVRGRIEIESRAGEGTELRIVVPITLAVLPCLIVDAATEHYAIPLHSVVTAQAWSTSDHVQAEGRPMIWVGDDALPLSHLTEVLGGEPSTIGNGNGTSYGNGSNGSNGKGAEGQESRVLVLAGGLRKHAFRVDRLRGQREVVVKGLGPLLPRVGLVAGASVEPNGSIVLVLDALGLIDTARHGAAWWPAPAAGGIEVDSEGLPASGRPRASILVVDDALTVRELERSILERAGYEVRTAADGAEALGLLAESISDLVLTDLDMPRLDGIALTEAIREHPTLANVPVVILTSRATDDDRQRGLDAGADAYIVKSAFNEGALVDVVQRLLGTGHDT